MFQGYDFLIKYLCHCKPFAADAYLEVCKFLHDTQNKVMILIIGDGNLRLIMSSKEEENSDSTKTLIRSNIKVMS
jgi:hypothetical protein